MLEAIRKTLSHVYGLRISGAMIPFPIAIQVPQLSEIARPLSIVAGAANIAAMHVSASALLGGLWERALDLVFPPRCVGCAASGAFLCAACLSAMPRAAPPRCPVCWMPSERRDSPCRRCHDRTFHFKAARSALVYEGITRDAVHALKYRGLSALARLMAPPLAECLRQWDPPVQAIVPVPLSGQRQRLRGYNQSELLAREVSRLTGLPLAMRALARRRSTPPQARIADEAARRQNVAGAFTPGPVAVKGGVLLIDDVLTTGATLDACARVLAEAGSGPVFALTFARED